ncbi:MAG TPA: hypothetical protein VGA36_03615 [Nitriliruptorales bacterium]
MVAAAVTFGAVGLATMLVLIGNEVIKGDRPEEEVAATFLEALYDGRGDEVYDLTTPGYQVIVFRGDLEVLSEALARTVGETSIEVLGSERTPGTEPQDSFVGYQGSSNIGTVEGVIVLVELGDGEWYVRDVSYGFPDASDEQIAELLALTEALNQQFAQRARQGAGTGDQVS